MGAISNAAGGILTVANNKFDSVVGVAKGIMCIPQLLSPDGLKSLASGILGGIQRQVAGMIVGLAGMVTSIVTGVVNQIVGKIGAEIAALNAFLKDIQETISLIKNVFKSLDDRAKATLKFLLDQENCKFAAAELGKCIVGDLLQDVNKKLAKDIVSGTKDINTEVNKLTTNLFNPDKSITKFVQRTDFMANKAATQLIF